MDEPVMLESDAVAAATDAIGEIDERETVDLSGKEDLVLDTGCTGLPFDVTDLSRRYGPSQRGATATQTYEAPCVIMSEVACVWMAVERFAPEQEARGEDDDDGSWEQEDAQNYRRFFMHTPKKQQPFYVCPAALVTQCGLERAIYVALAGIMIRDHEDVANLICGDSEWALHGSHDPVTYLPPPTAYALARPFYFPDPDKESWDLKRFARLYGVLQVNAVRGMIPFSTALFGVGLFTGAAFFNHSCHPNAVMMVQPGKVTQRGTVRDAFVSLTLERAHFKVVIQALTKIEMGEEITVAYHHQELPVEILSSNLVRTLHAISGMIANPLGCRCEVCCIHLSDEAEAGMSPDGARDVLLDAACMWSEKTAKRLEISLPLSSLLLGLCGATSQRVCACTPTPGFESWPRVCSTDRIARSA